MVGVIVTDGVIVRFDPVLLEWIPPLPPTPPLPPIPDDDLCGGPGINVAPPGNEERIGGYMLLPWLLWWLLLLLLFEFLPLGIDGWPRLQRNREEG